MPLKCETNYLQNPTEWQRFMRFAQKEQVTSYLEIGSKHGGTVWRMANNLPAGSRVVSVDLPHGDGSFKHSQPNLEACIAELKKRKYDAHLFLGDSTDALIIAQVRNLSPYDLVFIDANHTEPYVWQDWKNYGPMARMVAFHDIAWVARDYKKLPIEVRNVWDQIKQAYEHVEIKLCPRDNGIGILWRDRPVNLKGIEASGGTATPGTN